MRAIKITELLKDYRKLLDLAYNGETLFVTRPFKKNVVIMSEAEFIKREKALKNAGYLTVPDNLVKKTENSEEG